MRTLLLFLLAATAGTASAQTVSGVAKDDAGTPLSGATVALVKAKDTAVVKLAVVGSNGAYSFSPVTQGDYRVMVSHVGHNNALSAPFSAGSGDVTAPAMAITKAAADLKGITVTSRRQIIEVRADKTILNVEGTINAAGSDGLELLRKAPGVTVDKDENLSVNGKNGVVIYIDGRPSPLSGSDLANYLKSMQSSQVESIEIITNPSAKYEAAGNAGIINIRLKKNKAFGTNGSVNAGYSVGVFSRYNAGVNLNYRNKALNLYGTYSYSTGPTNNNINLTRTLLDTLFESKGRWIYDNRSHNFKVGADYTINKASSIGVMVNATTATPEGRNVSRTPIAYKPTGVVDRILVADNSSDLDRYNYNVNLNYNYNGAKGQSLVLNADRGYFNNDNNQYQPNYYFGPDGTTFRNAVIVRMVAPTIIEINSGKVDWEQNFQGGKLGLGGKISFVDTDNDFRRFNVDGNSEVMDVERSNRFVYKENINAGYINWNKGYKGVVLQAGLRVENTVAKGTNPGTNNSKFNFNRNYTNFFPSAAVTFNKNPMNQFTVSYSRRIDRPAYQDLNEFEMKLDEYTFQKGNSQLQPQFTNSVELTNVYKYRLTTKLGYSHVSDLFTQLVDTVDKSRSFLIKKNLATQKIVSLNVSYPFQYKAYSIFANLNANYNMNKANFGAGRTIDVNAFGATLFAQNSLRFGKVWTAELTGVYIAPTIFQGTFKSKAMGGVDIGLQKQIFKGAGTIKLSGTDIFQTFRFRATSDFAGQVTQVRARWEATQFKVNLNWRFGSTTVKAAKQKSGAAEDEKKRAEQSGGGLGIGNN